MNFDIISLDRSTETYKPIHFFNAYSLIDQAITTETIKVLNFENIRESNGISLIDNNKIKFSQNGCYLVDCSLNIEVKSANNNAEIYYLVRKNAEIINGVGGRLTLLVGNSKYSCHYNCIIRIEDFNNDYLEFCAYSSLNNVFISTDSTNLDGLITNFISPSIDIVITQIV